MKNFLSVILLCGGKGKRMGSPTPKQFLPLKNKILALYSFDFFSNLEQVKEIIVVCEPKYNFYFKSKKLLAFAPPGERRQDSVKSGVMMVSKESDLICIHDGARPFLKKEDVEKTIEEAEVYGSAALGAKIKNTIKECKAGFVERTLDRNMLYEIYTPQIIKKALLEKGLSHAEKEGIEVTDDLSLLEHIGKKGKIVDSSTDNIKITTLFDLKVAETMLTL